MPLQLDDNLPTKFPNPDYLTLGNFKRGVITLLDKSRLPKDALEQADNIFLVEDGNASVRPGTGWFGSVMPNGAAITGFDYFDLAGVIHLIVTAGNTVYRSLDDGVNWEACTGATLTPGIDNNFNQDAGFLNITNGVDNQIRYDGTLTLQVYTTLPTPSAPSMTVVGSLPGTSYTYYYKVSAVNQVGFTAASTFGSISVGTPRSGGWTSANHVQGQVPPVSGALRYDWYISEDGIDYFYLDSSVTNTLQDVGTAIPVTSTLAPTQNTTQGEKYEELTSIGSRQFGVRNTQNRYRIGFTGGSPFSGAFASAYGGGYLDWQTGGKYIPMKVADYRDGKGSPLATIWCDSADGQGCILQMSLDEVTVADGVTVIIPSAYKLPGSRGTPAPGSVINVLNDYYFYNSQAIYKIGNKTDLQQILSTDEMSANIRNTIKKVSTAGENKIATIYYDAKIYFSLPYGSASNNATCVYDTERKAWLPYAFTIGFKKFLRYTDAMGNQRLLAVKPGDNRLSEISSSIQGDYGQPFTTILRTGLYPVSKNRFEFQWTEEAEVEFSNPQGTVIVEVLGDERKRGFISLKQKPIVISGLATGWDSFPWDKRPWDDTSQPIRARSESSIKRYFNLQKELNSVQWQVTTNALDSAYVLRTLQTWGTITEGGKPRAWKLK